MKKCKHQDGIYKEFAIICHEREVKDGIIENEGYNEVGGLMSHEFYCYGCKKEFVFTRKQRLPKWLEKYINQIC